LICKLKGEKYDLIDHISPNLLIWNGYKFDQLKVARFKIHQIDVTCGLIKVVDTL
jgi:hypothetical protein